MPSAPPPLLELSICFILLLLSPSTVKPVHGNSQRALLEDDRMKEFHRRGHTWPPLQPNDYTPPTTGWSNLYNSIFEQLQYSAKDTPAERYEAFFGMVHSGITSRNFTEYGWGLTKAPKAIVQQLKKRLHDNLKRYNDYDNDEQSDIKVGYEPHDVCLGTGRDSLGRPELPYFVSVHDINQQILHDLLPLHEAWSNVELVPHYAYGLRVYRNESNLLMHLDKRDTHVISSILHVDHDPDGEPWPLVIEDFHGNTNEIHLESGDLLFYESSKCRHGRPKKFNGKFYSSLFSHYYPKEDWNTDESKLDIHYRIPQHDIWNRPAKKDDSVKINDMDLISLCMKEPSCEHEWCRLQKDTIKWYGPGPEYGKVLSGDGILITLEDIPSEASFDEISDKEL